MRKLTKSPKPQILVDNDQAWTVELLEANPGTPEFRKIEKRYGHEEIRQGLRNETHRKCAYCEDYIEAVSYPHIEHVRPKSTNRELTFTWENLTLGCAVCNTGKGDVEPVSSNFVHPYAEEPEQRFHFFGPVIAPANGDLAARNMINWLDLNRGGLVISRSEVANRVANIYLEAITLPHGARREFIELSLKPLTAAHARHSRAAAMMSAACEHQYSQMLSAPDT